MTRSISDRLDFPAIIEVDGTNDETTLDELRGHVQHKLPNAGALLIRGFRVLSPVEFAQLVRHVSGRPLQDYVGGASPQQRFTSGVYTSTEYSSALTLPLHNEMSYTYRWPRELFFACITTPKDGGETPIADSRAILRQIEVGIV